MANPASTPAPQPSPLATLRPHRPRRFVPATADLRDAGTVAGLFEAIVSAPPASRAAFERWTEDYFELRAAVEEISSLLFIEMTCHTDDPAHASAYKDFAETVTPAMKPWQHAFKRAFLEARRQFAAEQQEYDILARNWAADIALYRPEITPLETQEELLAQEYQTVSGAMTVTFDGAEQTLPQMSKYLYETDRAVRESAWRALTQRRLQDRDTLDAVFDKMLALREEIASRADCVDYTAYQFKAKHRFEYTREDCARFHDAVEACVKPVLENVMARRKKALGVASLRPWDLAVDPQGRPPLAPFRNEAELIERCSSVFNETDAELGAQFHDMHALGLLDLGSRKGKAPGGYQSTLSEARKPFIFMNAVGLDNDVVVLLHEGGHAFHAYASAHHEVLPYREAPIEFCEVASFGMELLGGEHLHPFYSEEDRKRSRHELLEGKIALLAHVATVDAFQHWIYTHPKHSRDERRQAWREVYQRFQGDSVDWTGFDDELESSWHRQIHIFAYPLYYIEYGIAQLGALQLWRNAKLDREKALRRYKESLALGGSRPLPELFAAAGLTFDFSRETIAPLVAAVQSELDGTSA